MKVRKKAKKHGVYKQSLASGTGVHNITKMKGGGEFWCRICQNISQLRFFFSSLSIQWNLPKWTPGIGTTSL